MVKRRRHKTRDLGGIVKNECPIKKYIAFEGIIGSGKSTMILKTKEWLESLNYKICIMEEPSKDIKKITGYYGIDDKIDTLLFVADRLIQQKRLKELPKDTIVLSERCFLSTFAYQSHALIGTLYNLHDITYGTIDEVSDDLYNIDYKDIERVVLKSDTFIFPDAVLILDVPVRIGRTRRGNFKKWETPDFLKEVRKKFQQMPNDKKYPFGIYLIDSNRQMDETFKDIQKTISEILGL